MKQGSDSRAYEDRGPKDSSTSRGGDGSFRGEAMDVDSHSRRNGRRPRDRSHDNNDSYGSRRRPQYRPAYSSRQGGRSRSRDRNGSSWERDRDRNRERERDRERERIRERDRNRDRDRTRNSNRDPRNQNRGGGGGGSSSQGWEMGPPYFNDNRRSMNGNNRGGRWGRDSDSNSSSAIGGDIERLGSSFGRQRAMGCDGTCSSNGGGGRHCNGNCIGNSCGLPGSGAAGSTGIDSDSSELRGRQHSRRPYSPPSARGYADRQGSQSPDVWKHDKWEEHDQDRSPSPHQGLMSLRFLRKLQGQASRVIPHLEETASTIASTDVHPPSSIGHESGHETGAEEVSLLGLSNPCSPAHSMASEGPIHYSEPLLSPARSLLST